MVIWASRIYNGTDLLITTRHTQPPYLHNHLLHLQSHEKKKKKNTHTYASITHRLTRWKQRRTLSSIVMFKVFCAHGSGMFTSCRRIHTAVVFAQLWVISCRNTRDAEGVSGSGCHKPLAGLALSAIEQQKEASPGLVRNSVVPS